MSRLHHLIIILVVALSSLALGAEPASGPAAPSLVGTWEVKTAHQLGKVIWILEANGTATVVADGQTNKTGYKVKSHALVLKGPVLFTIVKATDDAVFLRAVDGSEVTLTRVEQTEAKPASPAVRAEPPKVSDRKPPVVAPEAPLWAKVVLELVDEECEKAGRKMAISRPPPKPGISSMTDFKIAGVSKRTASVRDLTKKCGPPATLVLISETPDGNMRGYMFGEIILSAKSDNDPVLYLMAPLEWWKEGLLTKARQAVQKTNQSTGKTSVSRPAVAPDSKESKPPGPRTDKPTEPYYTVEKTGDGTFAIIHHTDGKTFRLKIGASGLGGIAAFDENGKNRGFAIWDNGEIKSVKYGDKELPQKPPKK
jgi:hypothetical protein